MKNMSRKREAFYTVSSNLLLQITIAICGFVLPPLIVQTYGSAMNGMVASITQFIAYLSIVEAGIGGASIAALYRPLAEDDRAKRNQILSATSWFYTRSGLIFTLLILLLALFYPLIIRDQANSLYSSLMVLVLGIAGTADFFLIGKYRVLLMADKKNYVISLIQILIVLFTTILSVFLIKIGSSLLFVKLMTSLLFISRYLVLATYTIKKYPDLTFNTVRDNKSISQSKNVLIHQISGLIVFNSPVVLITIFCSLKDASVYSVYAIVFMAINSLLSAFSSGMQSFFGESIVKDTHDKFVLIFEKYETLIFLSVMWVYSCAFLLIMPFMKLYTANMTDAEYIQPGLAILFVIVGLANNSRIPGNQIINAAGHFKDTQHRSQIEAGINLVCSIIAVILFGFKGVLIGSLCSYCFRVCDIIWYSNKHILKRNFLRSMVKLLQLLVIYIPLCYLLHGYQVQIATYVDWFSYAFICGLICIIPAVCYYFISRSMN
jgi:O-antigen/teichoic acid export membrane protein